MKTSRGDEEPGYENARPAHSPGRSGGPSGVAHPALELLREAGRIAAAARAHGAELIRPGAAVRDVCAAVEDEIRRRGGGLAFPAQSSRNAIAAHYCPSPDDP